jgi:hypothetical protein
MKRKYIIMDLPPLVKLPGAKQAPSLQKEIDSLKQSMMNKAEAEYKEIPEEPF